jgi:hypothetical protein
LIGSGSGSSTNPKSSTAGVLGWPGRQWIVGAIGVVMIGVAVEYDPNAAVGLDGALAKVVNQSYGSVLLGIVAVGLIAFALYSLS